MIGRAEMQLCFCQLRRPISTRIKRTAVRFHIIQPQYGIGVYAARYAPIAGYILSGNPRAPCVTKGTDKRGAFQKARVELAVFLIERKLRLLLAQCDSHILAVPSQIGVSHFDRIGGQFRFKPRCKTMRHDEINPDSGAAKILKIAHPGQAIGSVYTGHVILYAPAGFKLPL